MVKAGFSIIDDPIPAPFPPQEPVYQFQLPPVPRFPPEIPIVVDSPSQIVVEDAVIELTDVVVSLTVIKILRQEVELHIPSALTKYEPVA